jgi:hypothetical protein
MSSSPLPSKNNTFVQSQAQYFNRQNSNLTTPMNVNRHSPGPPSTTTRIVGPIPFYRSRGTPEPFDYTNNNRRQNDYQEYLQNPSQRRYSTNQINGKTKEKKLTMHGMLPHCLS